MTDALVTISPAGRSQIETARAIAACIGGLVGVAITTPEGEAKIAAAYRAAAKAVDVLDAARAAEKAPHLAAGRAVDAEFAAALGPLKTSTAALQRALGAYASERAAEQRRLQAEAVEAARAGDAERANDLVLATQDPVFAPVAAVADAIVEVPVWSPVVVSPADVPREYLVVDVDALVRVAKAAEKSGAPPPEIPGVRFDRSVRVMRKAER